LHHRFECEDQLLPLLLLVSLVVWLGQQEEEVADLADELCDCIKALFDVAVEYEILFAIAVYFRMYKII
jgi:hypothetical protein